MLPCVSKATGRLRCADEGRFNGTLLGTDLSGRTRMLVRAPGTQRFSRMSMAEGGETGPAFVTDACTRTL